MKKRINYLGMMAAVLAATACTSDELVNGNAGSGSADNVMSFTVKKKNMTRGVTAMEETGHYNFGVFAYKQLANGNYQTIMPNYLVGYKAPNGEKKGYAATSQTYGPSDNLTDGTSLWFYENLGTEQYDNQEDGYYKNSDAFYMSNNKKQYLKYWDYSANQVEFYAYAPYLNSAAGGATVAFSEQTNTSSEKKMTFSGIVAGFGDASRYEYMYASETRKPGDANYNHDVPLTFKRINGQVKLAFYEVVEGYDVQMIEYSTGDNNVQAKGNIITQGTYVVDFAGTTPTVTGAAALTPPATLDFKIPVGNEVTCANTTNCHKHKGYNRIANVKNAASENHPLTKGCLQDSNSQSATVYYCLPGSTAGSVKNGDLTFHMSYILHSLDTDETITVTNATVVVPAEYTQWESNKVYTYIFKITKDSNGGTGGNVSGLYPIVFDGITVQDYEAVQSEWVVSQIGLDKKLVTVKKDSTETVTATLNYEGTTSPTLKTATWTSDDEKVATVSAGGTGNLVATITGKAAGSVDVTIKAVTENKDGGTESYETAVCRVTVPLTLNKTEAVIKKDAKATLTTNAPTYVDGDAQKGEVSLTWVSSDETVATVTNGVVSAVKAGTATITATYKDAKGVEHTAECVVYVPLTISEIALEVASNNTEVLTTNMPTGVTWTTSDGSVATVNGGTVTGVKAGVATITAAYNVGTVADPDNVTATCTVTVPLELDQYEITLDAVKDENIINILNLPAGTDVSKITWTSSDETKVTVTKITDPATPGVYLGGIVKAIASTGSTPVSITAKYEYATGEYREKSCTVTVE